MKAGKLDREITILHFAESTTQDPLYGTVIVTEWLPLATVWAEVQDMLPSRGERLVEGINIARRPCRVRMRYRNDITSAMRIRIGTRELRIIAGPAELGRREGLEFMAEELSTEGQEP